MELLVRISDEQDGELQDLDNPMMDELNDDVYEENEENQAFSHTSFNFEERLAASKYTYPDSNTNYPQYFTYNYYNTSERESLSGNVSMIPTRVKNEIDITKGIVTISKQDYTFDQLLSIAKANNHGNLKTSDIIIIKKIRDPFGNEIDVIDKKQTLSRLEQILEENC